MKKIGAQLPPSSQIYTEDVRHTAKSDRIKLSDAKTREESIRMRKQIRRRAFETNSSSMHSLTVLRRNDKYTSEEILEDLYLHDDRDTGEKDCIWVIYDDDLTFGRSPFRALGTFKDKWLYACASLVKEYNDEIYKNLVAIALKHIPGLKRIELPILSDSVADKKARKFRKDAYYQKHGKTEKELQEFLSKKEKDWEMELNYQKSGDWWYYDVPYTGCVDEDILSGFLKQGGISVEEFITNKKYVVIQDGDEYQYWKDMKRTGLVNMGMIDHEYPKRDEYGRTEVNDNEETD